mmetsp:Transcript_30305/g.58372  ORF Transcript_30305/g.58372 Transcript_30305/m.58372 type:complete len:454 (+) Transcript_30305:121-1482(+)
MWLAQHWGRITVKLDVLLPGHRLEEKRIEDIYTKYHMKTTKAKKDLESANSVLEKSRHEVRRLKAAVEDEKETGDKYRLLQLQTQDKLLHARQTITDLKARLSILQGAADGFEAQELEAALEIIRRRREAPSHVAGIDPGSSRKRSAEELQREVHLLEARHHEVSTELKAKRQLLLVQQRTIEDQRRQLKLQEDRIQALQKRLEAKGPRRLMADEADDASVASSLFSVSSSIQRTRALVSKGGGVTGPHQKIEAKHRKDLANIISLRVFRARFSDDHLATSSGELLSCVVADLMDFPPAFSEMLGGSTPEYSLTVQYRVTVDAFLIEALAEACVELEVLTQGENVQGLDDSVASGANEPSLQTLGTAKIPVAGLLDAEKGSVGGRVPVVSIRGEEMGTIEYQLAVLWPLHVVAKPSVQENTRKGLGCEPNQQELKEPQKGEDGRVESVDDDAR